MTDIRIDLRHLPETGGSAPLHARRTAGKLAGFARDFIPHIRRDHGSLHYLDAGCGNGFITGFLAGGFDRVCGIDTEPVRLDEFRRRTDGDDRFSVHEMSADRMDFGDGVFQFVTSFEVLEHVPDLERTAGEIVRVMAPGGVLVVSVPHNFFPFENHGIRWKGRDIKRKIPLLPWIPPLHRRLSLARVFSSGGLNHLFVSRGLELLGTGYVAPQFERAGARKGTLESRLSFLRPLLDRCERIPLVRRLTGVSMLKAFRKPLA